MSLAERRKEMRALLDGDLEVLRGMMPIEMDLLLNYASREVLEGLKIGLKEFIGHYERDEDGDILFEHSDKCGREDIIRHVAFMEHEEFERIYRKFPQEVLEMVRRDAEYIDLGFRNCEFLQAEGLEIDPDNFGPAYKAYLKCEEQDPDPEVHLEDVEVYGILMQVVRGRTDLRFSIQDTFFSDELIQVAWEHPECITNVECLYLALYLKDTKFLDRLKSVLRKGMVQEDVIYGKSVQDVEFLEDFLWCPGIWRTLEHFNIHQFDNRFDPQMVQLDEIEDIGQTLRQKVLQAFPRKFKLTDLYHVDSNTGYAHEIFINSSMEEREDVFRMPTLHLDYVKLSNMSEDVQVRLGRKTEGDVYEAVDAERTAVRKLPMPVVLIEMIISYLILQPCPSTTTATLSSRSSTEPCRVTSLKDFMRKS